MKKSKSRIHAGSSVSDPSSTPAAAPRKTIPSILLEADYSEEHRIHDSPKQFATGAPFATNELPVSATTGMLLLQARDPHCLYAHSDLTSVPAGKPGGQVLLRVYRESESSSLAAEVRIEPQSSHWFIHVPDAGTTYLAELGYQDLNNNWVCIATSWPAATPHEEVCEDKSAQFMRMPSEPPRSFRLKKPERGGDEFPASGGLLTAIVPPWVSWIPALGPESNESSQIGGSIPELIAGVEGSEQFAFSMGFAAEKWTQAQECALNQMQSMENVAGLAISSAALFDAGNKLT